MINWVLMIDDNDIHVVLGLPAVANIVPVVAQGANPMQSATNLKKWMDVLAARHGGDNV